jgi:hypothetical protein
MHLRKSAALALPTLPPLSSALRELMPVRIVLLLLLLLLLAYVCMWGIASASDLLVQTNSERDLHGDVA